MFAIKVHKQKRVWTTIVVKSKKRDKKNLVTSYQVSIIQTADSELLRVCCTLYIHPDFNLECVMKN